MSTAHSEHLNKLSLFAFKCANEHKLTSTRETEINNIYLPAEFMLFFISSWMWNFSTSDHYAILRRWRIKNQNGNASVGVVDICQHTCPNNQNMRDTFIVMQWQHLFCRCTGINRESYHILRPCLCKCLLNRFGLSNNYERWLIDAFHLLRSKCLSLTHHIRPCYIIHSQWNQISEIPSWLQVTFYSSDPNQIHLNQLIKCDAVGSPLSLLIKTIFRSDSGM